MASRVIIAIIPIVGIVMGCVVVFFYLLWSHKERTLMIERGLFDPKPFDLEAFSLLAGILQLAVGITLSIVLGIIDGFNYSILGGLIPLALGLGFLAFFAYKAGKRN